MRTTPAGTTLTLKRDITNELDCLEIETSVSDAVAAARLLHELGYDPVVRVQKRRRPGRLGDWTICFDEVVNLGTFVEVEALYDDASADHPVQETLWQDVKQQFNLSDGSRVRFGYDTLLKSKAGR